MLDPTDRPDTALIEVGAVSDAVLTTVAAVCFGVAVLAAGTTWLLRRSGVI